MPALPDFEAWAIFAKVGELGSLSRAADELGISKATVSKALARLEHRLGTPLLHRNSRRLSLTESGRSVLERAAGLLVEGEAMEDEMADRLAEPRGTVRVTAPISFGILTLGELLPEFFTRYPQVTVDLRLSDRNVDLVAEGIDVALRIGVLQDSALRARRICEIRRPLVAAPAYLERYGTPSHPRDLADHRAILFSHLPAPGIWRFDHASEPSAEVKISGPLLLDNGDVAVRAMLAGLGLGVVPEFLVWRHVQSGRLVELLPGWVIPPIALHIVTPQAAVRPARIRALTEFFAEYLTRQPWVRVECGSGR